MLAVWVTVSIGRIGDVAVFENRQPVTKAEFINNYSLFIQSSGNIRQAGTEVE